MQYPKQKEILKQAADVEALFVKRGIDLSQLHGLLPLVREFEIRIPFIGQFSSGKSSLINTLIGEPLLATEITAETVLPAEIRYGSQPKFTGHLGNGQTISVTRAQVEENDLTMLLPAGWLLVEMPADFLSSIPQLVLVDLPGWDSGVEAHHQVIDQYASRSLAYAVVVSVEEGTLRESLRLALNELALQNKPVLLVVTKAHKRQEEDAKQVAAQLSLEISKLMGREPLAIAITSAAKNDVKQLQSALVFLQKQAEKVFNESVANSWISQLLHAKHLLELLASTEFKDVEAIKAEIESFELKMLAFDKHLQQETKNLESSTGPMLSAIRMRVENALLSQLESLASHALNGGNVGNNILGIARMSVSQALKEDFEPTLRRYLERLAEALPNSLGFDFNVELNMNEGSGGAVSDQGFKWTDLTIALGPILARFTGPIGMAIGTLVPFLARLLDDSSTRNRQEADEARQREKAKSQIRDAIAQAVEQIESKLAPAMAEHIAAARQSIEESIAADKADIEKTLTVKQQALQAGEAEAAAQREVAQQDVKQVQQWLSRLGYQGKE